MALAQSPRVVAISHCGEHLRHPENTLPAFQAAIDAGGPLVPTVEEALYLARGKGGVYIDAKAFRRGIWFAPSESMGWKTASSSMAALPSIAIFES